MPKRVNLYFTDTEMEEFNRILEASPVGISASDFLRNAQRLYIAVIRGKYQITDNSTGQRVIPLTAIGYNLPKA